jgi:hypothetical protein
MQGEKLIFYNLGEYGVPLPFYFPFMVLLLIFIYLICIQIVYKSKLEANKL